MTADNPGLRAFIDQAPVAIALLDRDCRYVAASPRWRRDYGLGDRLLQGRRHDELLPEVPAGWTAAHQRCLDGTSEHQDEEQVVRPDGTRRWIRWAMDPWRPAGSEVAGIIIVSEDVTARKDADAALAQVRTAERENAETFRALLDTAAQGILGVDADGTIASANAALAAMFGWQPEELVGQPLDRLLPAATRAMHAAWDAGYWRAPHSRPMGTGRDLQGQRRDGTTFPVEVSLNYVPTSAGGRAFAFVTDISARKASEDELARAHRALLERARELEARTAQLSRLASELTLAEQHAREQLAKTLHDHLQQLLFASRLKLDRASTRLVSHGADAGDLVERARRDLDEAIAAARSLAVELFPPMLHDSGLAAALTWLAGRMEQQYGLAVTLSLDADATRLRRDIRTLVFESVRELLFNVVKHAKVDRVALTLSRADGDGMWITVEDGGIGFDPAGLGRPDARHGGLGLVSIRERLALFGGHLAIDSRPGHGALFTLLIPSSVELCEAPADCPDSDATAVRPGGAAAERPLTVLIADDHALVRDGLRDLLDDRRELRVVGQAGDGLEALALAHALRPDVIVMDVSMPGLDGVEATRRLRLECPDIQVFGLSTEERSDKLHAIEEAGASGYFSKSEDTHRLVERLLAVQRQRSGAPPPEIRHP